MEVPGDQIVAARIAHFACERTEGGAERYVAAFVQFVVEPAYVRIARQLLARDRRRRARIRRPHGDNGRTRDNREHVMLRQHGKVLHVVAVAVGVGEHTRARRDVKFVLRAILRRIAARPQAHDAVALVNLAGITVRGLVQNGEFHDISLPGVSGALPYRHIASRSVASGQLASPVTTTGVIVQALEALSNSPTRRQLPPRLIDESRRL